MPQAPSKSTLDYANEHRSWELYQKVFETLFARCQGLAGAPRCSRFRNPLLSIDGTVIDRCATICDSAKYQSAKGAAKLHLVLGHDGYLPRFGVITEGKASEVKVARGFHFEPGTIVVFDRGYVDYKWHQRDRRGSVLGHSPAARCALSRDREPQGAPEPEHPERRSD